MTGNRGGIPGQSENYVSKDPEWVGEPGEVKYVQGKKKSSTALSPWLRRSGTRTSAPSKGAESCAGLEPRTPRGAAEMGAGPVLRLLPGPARRTNLRPAIGGRRGRV